MPVSFRRNVAQEVIALREAGAQEPLQKVARMARPGAGKFPIDAWRRTPKSAQAAYKADKKLFESRKETARKWVAQYQKGEFLGLTAKRNRATQD